MNYGSVKSTAPYGYRGACNNILLAVFDPVYQHCERGVKVFSELPL